MNNIQKVLEGANIKLASSPPRINGRSCLEMLQQIVEGNQDPAAVAERARTRMRSKLSRAGESAERYRTAAPSVHARHLAREHESLVEETAAQHCEVAERMRPCQAAIDLLDEFPGVGRTAECIIASSAAPSS